MANFFRVEDNNVINLDMVKQVILSKGGKSILVIDDKGQNMVYQGDAAKYFWDTITSMAAGAVLTKEFREEYDRYRDALVGIAHGPVGYWNEPQYREQVISQLMQMAEKALRPGGA